MADEIWSILNGQIPIALSSIESSLSSDGNYHLVPAPGGVAKCGLLPVAGEQHRGAGRPTWREYLNLCSTNPVYPWFLTMSGDRRVAARVAALVAAWLKSERTCRSESACA